MRDLLAGVLKILTSLSDGKKCPPAFTHVGRFVVLRLGTGGSMQNGQSTDQTDSEIDRLCHDLRTPLSAVQAFADLLNDEVAGTLGEDQRAYVGAILRGVADLAEQIDEIEGRPVEEAAAEQSPCAPLGNAEAKRETTVLVIEDHVELNRAMCLLLRSAGLQVESAFDGLEGLARIESLAPDAVLLDLTLPRLNGREVLRRLAGRNAPPILVMTGDPDPKFSEATEALGIHKVLQKPVNRDMLIEAVRAVVA